MIVKQSIMAFLGVTTALSQVAFADRDLHDPVLNAQASSPQVWALPLRSQGETGDERFLSTKWLIADSDADERDDIVALFSFNPHHPHADISIPLDVLRHSDDARLREAAASLLARHIGFLRSQMQLGRETTRELERYRQHDQRREPWDKTPRSPLEF